MINNHLWNENVYCFSNESNEKIKKCFVKIYTEKNILSAVYATLARIWMFSDKLGTIPNWSRKYSHTI